MKVLVTGFDPFGGEPVNPAIEAVKKLPDTIAGAKIIKLEIPTVAFKSLEMIKEAIDKHDPDVILSIGQAGGRTDITVERVGINVDDFRIKDNEGNQFIDTKIYSEGPDAYLVNLPIKAMVEEIKKNSLPASISNTAGTFVCNHVTYGVRHICEVEGKSRRSGFIHIPYLPEQVVDKPGQPCMSVENIVTGLTAAIKAIVENKEDIKVGGGATH